MEKKPIIVLGMLIASGLIVLGICIKSGLNSFSDKERIVTVKGLAEKLVKANIADINITVAISGDNSIELVKKLDNEIEIIKKLLDNSNSKSYEEIKISELTFFDSKEYYSYDWLGDKKIKTKKDRYYLSKVIKITTKEVEKAELLSQDLILTFINNDITVNVLTAYNFPILNDIKPELIAESTKNARASGEQFANDSKSKLGKIKTATQGQISIVGRSYGYGEDYSGLEIMPEEPYYEKVRVVSTIVFFLED